MAAFDLEPDPLLQQLQGVPAPLPTAPILTVTHEGPCDGRLSAIGGPAVDYKLSTLETKFFGFRLKLVVIFSTVWMTGCGGPFFQKR